MIRTLFRLFSQVGQESGGVAILDNPLEKRINTDDIKQLFKLADLILGRFSRYWQMDPRQGKYLAPYVSSVQNLIDLVEKGIQA